MHVQTHAPSHAHMHMQSTPFLPQCNYTSIVYVCNSALQWSCTVKQNYSIHFSQLLYFIVNCLSAHSPVYHHLLTQTQSDGCRTIVWWYTHVSVWPSYRIYLGVHLDVKLNWLEKVAVVFFLKNAQSRLFFPQKTKVLWRKLLNALYHSFVARALFFCCCMLG